MKAIETKKKLSATDREQLLETLQARFEKNMKRHTGVSWATVRARVKAASPAKLSALHRMEETGGEPDVMSEDKKSGEIIFVDCSAQTPEGRVSLCYDDEALQARKENKPKGSAVDMAKEMGVELLSEEEYFELQKLGEFDTKRSSWIKTPPEIRKLGGALWCGRSYGRVFIGSNGAESYYQHRGFRTSLLV